MSFRTTSTAISPSRRLVRSVLPLRFDNKENPLNLGLVLEDAVQRTLDHLLACLNASPSIESRFSHGLVDFEGQIQRGTRLGYARASCPSPILQIVVQCPKRRPIPQLAWSILP